MIIKNIKEAEDALLPFVPLVAQLTGKDTTFERIVPLMRHLGNPQDRLNVIHIAGTSGKTSTAYYITSLLKSAGVSTGLTVSPHVDSITERVQLDGAPLPNKEFCKLLSEFLEKVDDVEEKPSYFELLYAFSLWVFDKKHVDYAVIETGMGGLHDATNIVTRRDKICVITDIGFDHMHILGHTLPEIALQKIGIAHAGNNVYMFEQGREVMDTISEYVKKVGASLHILHEIDVRNEISIDLSLLPEYQRRNWLLAYSVFVAVNNRDHLASTLATKLKSTLHTYIPGRMDISRVKEKTVIMDGAHNAQKMEAFITSFKSAYPGVKPAILLAMKTGKEYNGVVPILSDLASEVIVTRFCTSQDLPAKSIEPQILVDAFKSLNNSLPVTEISNLHDAYGALLKSASNAVIVTGSFYLLSQIRKLKT